MSITKARINSVVDQAFKAFGEIVLDATLTKTSVTGFDFSTGELIDSSSPIAIEVIPISTKLNSTSQIEAEFLAKRSDFNLSNYNTLTIGSEVYRLENQELFEGVVVLTCRRSIDD